MLDVILILFLLLLFLGALNIYQYEMNNSLQGVEEDLETLNKAHSALEQIKSNKSFSIDGVKVTSQAYRRDLKSVEIEVERPFLGVPYTIKTLLRNDNETPKD